MINFELINNGVGCNIDDIIGDIKFFASEGIDIPLKEQFDKNYSFGGGWNPMEGFTMKDTCLIYPNDPPLKPIAKASFRNQTIYVYNYAWVAIVEKDGSFEASRMD